MVTDTGLPAVCGEATGSITKWSTALGMTWMGALVAAVIAPFVWSVADRVCVPTVPSLTLSWSAPLSSVPLSGVFAAGSVEVRRTASEVGTGFHHVSVPYTLTLNGRPAPCVAAVPVLPATLPGSGTSPGTTTCRRANVPGWTVNGSLVPFFCGAAGSQA